MRQANHCFRLFVGCEGKGTLGCLLSLFLVAVAAFAGFKLLPIYYSFSGFESDLKTEVSRAGARFYDDDMIVRDILELAKKNQVQMTQDNIRVERFAGQLRINVYSTVPVDFFVFQHTLVFDMRATSYIGRL
jgi:hypothetical protein